jgi:AraC-like DNA-binding protein
MTGMYAERAPAADLAGHLRCSWTRTAAGSGTVLPDGCLDLMWIGGQLVVAGPDTVATRSELAAGVEIAAVRFRPGAAPAVLGLPAFELRDQRVPLAELWAGAGQLARRVDAAADRVAVIEAAVRRRLADAPPVDPVALAVARRLSAGPPVALALAGRVSGGAGIVSELARRAGLSERQLHRRCLAAFGYGPKTLERILRLQRFLALGRADPGAGLARLAADAGYADQAHLGHDCRALTGATPGELVAPSAAPLAA